MCCVSATALQFNLSHTHTHVSVWHGYCQFLHLLSNLLLLFSNSSVSLLEEKSNPSPSFYFFPLKTCFLFPSTLLFSANFQLACSGCLCVYRRAAAAWGVACSHGPFPELSPNRTRCLKFSRKRRVCFVLSSFIRWKLVEGVKKGSSGSSLEVQNVRFDL